MLTNFDLLKKINTLETSALEYNCSKDTKETYYVKNNGIIQIKNIFCVEIIITSSCDR